MGTFGKTSEKKFDLILTNPPYVTNSSANIKKGISDIFDNVGKPYYQLKGRGVETIAIEWIIKNLVDGGEAIVVVPDGLFTQKTVIKYIKKTCVVNAIISLPKNTFYATSKKTYILHLNKKTKNLTQQTPVFTYIVGEIGETRDTKRFVNDEYGNLIRNDLDECVKNYILFKNGITDLKSERTKIIDFKVFDDYKDWLIEKKLTDEEKIKIGLMKPIIRVSEEEFIESLEHIDKYINSVVTKGLPESPKTSKYVDESLDKYFVFPEIKGLTEKFIRNNSGMIPIYGGRQMEEAVGHIADKLAGVKYFENCLAWNREGSVGYVFYHNHKFTTNDHHRPMVLKEEFKEIINLKYVRMMLEKTLLESDDFEWSKTASKEKVKKIKIAFPVDKDGNPDYEEQQRIALRAESYDKIIKELSSKISMVCEASLDYFS
nr:N-6 DNA methylase [uncultured Anaerocolumna sp.]